jgi:hypothetical protein
MCSVHFFGYKVCPVCFFKFVLCAFLIRKICSVCFLRLQKFVVHFFDILQCP